MVLLPLAALAVLITVYMGGPSQALDTIARAADDWWDRLSVMMRR